MALRRGAMLKSVTIFQDVEPAQAEFLASRCDWHRYSKGRQIIGQEDKTTDVFFIVQGTVQAVGYSSAGKAVSFGDFGAGDIFGEFSAIDGLPRSSAVAARTNCIVARLSSEVFRDILNSHPGIALRLLEIVLSKTRTLNERVFEYSTLPVQSRLHSELLRMSQLVYTGEKSATIEPAPTHQEIASRISSHREAVTRELNRLAEEGVLTLGRRRIDVLDGTALRELVDRARMF
ncbi:MAG: cyclic nucleotide-binding domain-containing protein [Alphaproteobacteria bacterium]|nr:cyclic nucleotide-binding domain-containing protein [Alphaproteobacteria bacterium]